MAELTEKVACRTPAPGRTGTTNIPRWKFECLRRAILGALADGPLPFADLPERAGARLTAAERAALGSLGWHVTTVKLELETRGEIRRLAGRGPQRLALAGPDDGR